MTICQALGLRGLLPVFVVAAIAILPAPAGAVEPTLDQLPAATHASALTTGPDGEVWFLGSQGRSRPGRFIGTYRADGTLGELPVPEGRVAGTLVVDPGVGFWFGEELRSKRGLLPRIGHVSTAGEFTDHKPGLRPGGITSLGLLHGNLWFGVSRRSDDGPRGSIRRFDPSTGRATTVLRLPPRCKPDAVAATTDAIVFVEICLYKLEGGDVRRRVSIDRLDPATREVGRLRLRHGAPASLVVGADGSVWFGTAANGFGSKPAGSEPTVGRISPGGKLSEYPAPGAADLGSAALGPEGRLWFPSSVPGHGHEIRGLNSIGPQGDLGVPFCIAADCQLEPSGLLARPDGSIWFGAGKTQVDPPSGSSGIAQEIYTAAEAGYIGHFAP